MRVLLSTWGSRGDVEPLLGLALELQELGATPRLCAPPDFAESAARLGVEMVPAGRSVRALVHGTDGARPSTPADAPRVAAQLVAAHFETVGAAADGCDAVLATGLMPAGVRSVAEQRGIPYVLAAFHSGSFPSPDRAPLPRPGKPFPPGETDYRVLWEIDAERVNALYREPLNAHRAAVGLPPVDNVRDHVFTDRPWLATDPTLEPWPGSPYLDVLQTGAWMLPDERPLPSDLDGFLQAGEPPVYVSMGSVRAPADVAAVAIEAIREHGRRVVVGRGWAELALIDDGDDCLAVGEVNHQALFRRVAAVVHHGGAGTTTTAARAGVPQVVVPQMADQPYWAGRVAELGVGAAHDGPTPTVETLSAALATALAPQTRARATAVAGLIRTDGAKVAAELLIDMAGHQERAV
ncbi:glycosyltransferase [Mycobacterium sp. NPDC048908]|uniref:glycosyltransferase n=1 Tax=Mycobacterium sp. NPDC048908 TaxID=3364292 RepID=UPI003711E89F